MQYYLFYTPQMLYDYLFSQIPEVHSINWIVPDHLNCDLISLYVAETFQKSIASLSTFSDLEAALFKQDPQPFINLILEAKHPLFNTLDNDSQRYLLAKKIHHHFTTYQTPSLSHHKDADHKLFLNWLDHKKKHQAPPHQAKMTLLNTLGSSLLITRSDQLPTDSLWYRILDDAMQIKAVFIQIKDKNEIKDLKETLNNPVLCIEEAPKAHQNAILYPNLKDECQATLKDLETQKNATSLVRIPASKHYQLALKDPLKVSTTGVYDANTQSLADEPFACHLITLLQALKTHQEDQLLNTCAHLLDDQAINQARPLQLREAFIAALSPLEESSSAIQWLDHFSAFLDHINWNDTSPTETVSDQNNESPSSDPLNRLNRILAKASHLAQFFDENQDDFKQEAWIELLISHLNSSTIRTPLSTLPTKMLCSHKQICLIPFDSSYALGFSQASVAQVSEIPFYGIDFKAEEPQALSDHQDYWYLESNTQHLSCPKRHQNELFTTAIGPHWEEAPLKKSQKSSPTTHTSNVFQPPSLKTKTRFSITELELFRRAPLDYYFEKIAKVPKLKLPLESISASDWGTWLHRLLEQSLSEPFDTKHFLKKASLFLKTDPNTPDLFKAQLLGMQEGQNEGNLLGRLSIFFDAFFKHFKIVALEYPVSYVLENQNIVGKLDMICQCKQSQAFLIVDFKTGAKLPSRAAIERFESLQLGFYAQAIQAQFGSILGASYVHISKQSVKLELSMVDEALKEHPFLEIKRRCFPRTKTYQSRLQTELLHLISEIKAGHFFSESKAQYRDFCDYVSAYAYQN